MGQVQGGSGSARAFLLFQQVGNVLATNGSKAQRMTQGLVDFLRSIDFTESDDLLDMMGGIESLFVEPAGIVLGVGTHGQKAQQGGLSTGLAPLIEQFPLVLRVADPLVAVVAAKMGGDECFMVIVRP